jgi:DNA-binding HxlR family transcriptional regulator
MSRYHQFCPVAVAAELLATTWMPLVVRELLCGSVRFNDLHRGLPRMSRTLLARRLAQLERAAVVERRLVGNDRHPEYHLTPAGQALFPVVSALAVWGRQWSIAELAKADYDPAFLMWDVQRRIVRDRLPKRRIVVAFHFTDGPRGSRDFWLVCDPSTTDVVDLCLTDPGFGIDLTVTSDTRSMVDVWMGDAELARLVRAERVQLHGRREYRSAFPSWLGLSVMASVPRQPLKSA